MKESNWVKVSAIAEIVSSIAILLTLIYLAMQVNQNTDALRAQSRQALLDSVHSELATMFENPDVIMRAIDDEPMSEREQFQFATHFIRVFRSREFSWLQWQDGTMDDAQWQTEYSVIRLIMDSPRVRQWWNASGSLTVSPEFATFVNDYIGASEATGLGWQTYTTWANQD